MPPANRFLIADGQTVPHGLDPMIADSGNSDEDSEENALQIEHRSGSH